MSRALVFVGCWGCAGALAIACENDAYLGLDPLATDGGAAGESSTGGDSSGGTGSGGLSEGGAPQGGTEGGFDCPASSLFCSGFEEPDLLSEWSTWQRNGDTAAETTNAPIFNGESALRVQLESTGTNSRLVQLFDDPVLTGSLSARAFFYIPSTTPNDATMIGIELKHENSGGSSKASINWAPDQTTRLVVTSGVTPETSNSAPGAFELDTWNCAVLRIELGEEGRVEAVINGQVVLSAEGNTIPPGGYGQFLLGALRGDSSTSDFEMFYDDAVVAPGLLDCP